MSRIYESGQYFQQVKEVRNGLEREYTEEERWKRHEESSLEITKQQQQQQHYGLQPTKYVGKANYRPKKDEYWQCRRLRSSDRDDTTSGLGVTYRDTKPTYNSAQIVTQPATYYADTKVSHDRNNYQVKPQLQPGSPQVLSGAGDIINTEHGFTIRVDAKHFRPNDIQITLHQHTLSVIGDRLENDGSGVQRLRRSFIRKYSIPPDVQLSSIFSYMTDTGQLIIKGSRRDWKETDLTKHLAPTAKISATISAV